MADTAIASLSAVTTISTGDLLVLVDVDDTTMASSGTDYKMTLAQLFGAATGDVTFSGFASTVGTIGGQTVSLAGAFSTSGAHALILTLTADTNVTLPTSGTLATTAVATLSSLASIGTITTGVWHGSVIAGQYGGTGVANTGSTITVGGNVTFSGAFATTLTVTNTTSVTLPTSGTLLSTAAVVTGAQGGTGVANTGSTITIGGNVTFSGAFTFTGTLSNTTAVTFPTSGTLLSTAAAVTVAQGGTGDTSLTAYAVLCGGTTTTGNVQSIASVGNSGQVLTSNGAGALPTFQNATGGGTSTGLTFAFASRNLVM